MYRVWLKIGQNINVSCTYNPDEAFQELIHNYRDCPLLVSQGAYKTWLEYVK